MTIIPRSFFREETVACSALNRSAIQLRPRQAGVDQPERDLCFPLRSG